MQVFAHFFSKKVKKVLKKNYIVLPHPSSCRTAMLPSNITECVCEVCFSVLQRYAILDDGKNVDGLDDDDISMVLLELLDGTEAPGDSHRVDTCAAGSFHIDA